MPRDALTSVPTWRIRYRDGHLEDVTADWCDEHPGGWTFQSVRWVVIWQRWVVHRRVARDDVQWVEEQP